jgi:hypothetical protein
MGRVWRALGKGKELGRSVVGGLGERVRTVVTEVMSRSMNHLVQRSDKTLGPIEPVMEVKWVTKGINFRQINLKVELSLPGSSLYLIISRRNSLKISRSSILNEQTTIIMCL